MNRRFAFIVAILGGFIIAAGAFQVWSAITTGDPFRAGGIVIFVFGWLLGWTVLYGLTNLVLRRRKESMDTLESELPPEDDHERLILSAPDTFTD
ncbi:hypothetical protein ACFL6T_02040 [Candidatus Zixiibacteriota bacterium]